jgi:hypothetical protein
MLLSNIKRGETLRVVRKNKKWNPLLRHFSMYGKIKINRNTKAMSVCPACKCPDNFLTNVTGHYRNLVCQRCEHHWLITA